MGYEEIMAAIKDINGPWSNAACRGYCRMAMKSAGVDEKTQNDVLRELHFCMDANTIASRLMNLGASDDVIDRAMQNAGF